MLFNLLPNCENKSYGRQPDAFAHANTWEITTQRFRITEYSKNLGTQKVRGFLFLSTHVNSKVIA